MLLSIEDFKERNLVELLRSIKQHCNANWHALPFTQKYYLFAKQCFVRKFCKCGKTAVEALKIVDEVKKNNAGEKLEDIIDVNVLYDLENILVILD